MENDPRTGDATAMATDEARCPLVAGRYRLRSPIGAGGFGAAWRAVDERLNREVAVKLLARGGASRTEWTRRFLREAEATARLDHPNAVTIHDAGEEPEHGCFLVLELVDGRPLNDVLREGALPVDRAVGIAKQIAAALHAAHSVGIVHRDIKPANVLVRSDGAVKVCDFGIAHLLGEARISVSSAVVGTPAYMAPEQLQGKSVGPPADIFALGCVLFEMLAGTLPFEGTLAEMNARVLGGHPNRLPEPLLRKNPDLSLLIGEMLAVEAAARPSAKEVNTRLDREGAVRAPFEATAERVAIRWLVAAALAAFALVAGAIVFSGREAGAGKVAGTNTLAAPTPAAVPQETTARESPPSYSGQPISFDLEDADIRDVVLSLARSSGLNVAIDPDVQGRVDAHFQDVPWDQALDLFLEQNGLTYAIEGKVFRVSKATDQSPKR